MASIGAMGNSFHIIGWWVVYRLDVPLVAWALLAGNTGLALFVFSLAHQWGLWARNGWGISASRLFEHPRDRTRLLHFSPWRNYNYWHHRRNDHARINVLPTVCIDIHAWTAVRRLARLDDEDPYYEEVIRAENIERWKQTWHRKSIHDSIEREWAKKRRTGKIRALDSFWAPLYSIPHVIRILRHVEYSWHSSIPSEYQHGGSSFDRWLNAFMPKLLRTVAWPAYAGCCSCSLVHLRPAAVCGQDSRTMHLLHAPWHRVNS